MNKRGMQNKSYMMRVSVCNADKNVYIFLQSPCQVGMKNAVKYWKGFLLYFTTLETYCVQLWTCYSNQELIFMAVAVSCTCYIVVVVDLLRLCQICVLILSSYQTLLWSPTKLNHSHNGTECSSKQKHSDYTDEVLKIHNFCCQSGIYIKIWGSFCQKEWIFRGTSVKVTQATKC